MKEILIQICITDEQAKAYIHTESNQEIAEQPQKIFFLADQIFRNDLSEDTAKFLEPAQVFVTVSTIDPEEAQPIGVGPSVKYTNGGNK